jgi:hypothetical protein
MRLGGLVFAGAALLAVGAIALQWPMTPALLHRPLIEFVFIAAGTVVLAVALVSLALDRREATAHVSRPARAVPPSSESSLMALPALVSESSSPSPAASLSPAPGEALRRPDTPEGVTPVGVAAASAGNSTLLIPFAGESTPPGPGSGGTGPGQTVSRLVDRIDALQRVTSSGTPSTPAPEDYPASSPLLLRLTRVPTPPTLASATTAPRRCNDCGEPLGSPPQFESCVDCGRAMCERCYWRTSSGPRAHLCTVCFQDRSVPRPPTPAVTFATSGPIVSASTPSGRRFRSHPPGS